MPGRRCLSPTSTRSALKRLRLAETTSGRPPMPISGHRQRHRQGRVVIRTGPRLQRRVGPRAPLAPSPSSSTKVLSAVALWRQRLRHGARASARRRPVRAPPQPQGAYRRRVDAPEGLLPRRESPRHEIKVARSRLTVYRIRRRDVGRDPPGPERLWRLRHTLSVDTEAAHDGLRRPAPPDRG